MVISASPVPPPVDAIDPGKKESVSPGGVVSGTSGLVGCEEAGARSVAPNLLSVGILRRSGVFPTLTGLNLTFGSWLATMAPVPRTFVLATVAVPIVIYGLTPHLHRARARLLSRPGGG